MGLMFTGAGVGEEAGSRTIEDTTAAVNFGCNEGMDQGFGSREAQ